MSSGREERATPRTDVGFATTACAPIIENRYGERCHSIDDVVALLQQFKAQGAQNVQITDGYYGHAFNIRWQGVPNFDRPCTVILRPVNNRPDFDGVVRETGELLEKSSSLVRQPSAHAPPGCHCQERCAAPVVMGRQTECRDPEKAARLAKAEA